MVDTNKTGTVIRLQAWDKNGKLKFDDTVHNLGMTVRLPVIAGLYGGVDSQTAFSYLAVGETATAPAANQTTLVLEITGSGLARASATVSRVTTNSTNDTTRFYKLWNVSASKTVQEVAYFNASSGGVMGGRALTGTKTLDNGDTFSVTYDVIHS